MINHKIKSLIGFAIRSNNILYGLEGIERSKKPPQLILICKTLSENTKKKAIAYCTKNSVKFYELTTDTLEELTAKKNCKLIGLTDKMMANGLINSWEADASGGKDFE